jgi:hypothetical protein
MPTGRLRKGFVKVAGVASDEAYLALLEVQRRDGLPSLSRALGKALDEWLQARGGRVLSSPGPADGPGSHEIRCGRSEPNKVGGGEDYVS